MHLLSSLIFESFHTLESSRFSVAHAVSCSTIHLLGLLGCSLSTSEVALYIGLVVDLLKNSLGGVPRLTGGWRYVLALSKGITTSTELLNHALHERALADTGAQEDGVEDENDPAALSKDDGGSENAEPEGELETGDYGHAGVIVVLDEATNGVCNAGSWGLLACWNSWRRLNDWEKDATSICQDVEDAVNGVWQHCEWVLLGEEPQKSHSCKK